MAVRNTAPPVLNPVALTNVSVTMSGMPQVTNIVQNIKRMRDAFLLSVEEDLRALSVSVESSAQKLAHSVYESHYDRHQDSARYPNKDVAADSIFSTTFRAGEQLGVSLGYSADVIQTVGRRAPITYGGILESNYWGDYAVIRPTMEDYQFRLLEVLSGSLGRFKGNFK